MVKNFMIELANTQFRFNTLSSSTLQVFQVYVPHRAKQQRFHMQRRGDTFFITDPAACPPEYLGLEGELSAAIFNSQPTPSGAR
jgi:hypothetical protein